MANDSPCWTSAYAQVVTDLAGRYAVWPSRCALPPGWRPVGFTSTGACCLAFIAEVTRRREGVPLSW